ncbi:hypothetical protein PV328_008313 [Microctonus aethiopoides]|uniref:Uncharacterized protein n=2 Tax=Microctonus aethiopoides TaxID=144406 RepID=A0AA39CBE9_9HYME|nr:hypothetical protein PV328_008313 [Microctonus aethiopoides]
MDENNEYLSNANGEYETQTSFFKQAQNRATINVSNFDEDTSLFAYGKSSNGKIKNRRVGYNNDEDDDDDDDEDDEEDDDLGPETDVDAVDDAGEINTLANVSRELFLDKDSADDFNCENTVDDDTPMISSITKPSQNELIAEPENVGDSEESDDEWNYYKVDSNKDKDVNNIVLSEIEAQSESVDDKFLNENNIKLQPEEIFVSEKEQQQQLEDNEIDSCSDSDTESERKVCSNDLINSKISEKKIKEPVVVQVTADNPEDMDFQLNPDAAEFIPVSPVIPPRLLDRPISGSPLKQTPTMDDIRLPSPKEFSEEANHRPHEVESMINSSNDDFIASSNNDGGEFVEKQKILFNLDESEISSTRAEFGDESTASFLTAADYSKNDGMDGSFTNSCISTCDNGSMMMSFGPGAFNPLGNPVDLNAVHDLSDTDLCDSNDQTLPIDLQENNWEKDTNHFNKSDDRDVHSPDIHPELVNLISPESDQPPHSKAFPDHQGDDLFSPSSPVLKSNPNIDEFHEQVESISSEVAAMNLKNDQLSEVHDDKSQSLNISSVLSDVNEEIPKTESLIEQPLDTDDLLLSQPPVTHMEVDDHSSPGLQSNSSLDHCSEETVKISISKSNEIQQQYQVDLKSNDSVESFYPKFHLKGNDIDVKDCELDEKEDETGVKESQIDLKQIEESIISRENHTTSSHVKVFENTLETTSLLHDKHESTIDESIDDSQEKMKITFEDDDDPICQQFDSTTGDSFSRLLSPTMKPQEKHKENIECTLPPIESQVLNALSDTTLELSKSVQEFTGIENELIPMTNGNASKAEIQAPETTICEPVIKDVCQKSQNETIPTLSITEDIVKLTAEEEPINTSQKPTIVASVAAITSDTTVGAIINSTADVKFRSTTKSSQKIAARTVSTKSNNKLSPTSPTKVSTSVPSRPKSSPITKKTITTTIAPTAARSKPAEVTSKSSLTVNKSPTAIKSTVKPLAPKPKSTILKTSSAVVEKKSSGTITINGDTTKSAAAKLPSKPRVTGTSITSKPSAKSTTISVRSTTGLTAKSKPTVGSTAARVVTKTSSGVTSTIGAVAAAPTRPKTAPATLGIMKSRVQSSTKSPTLDKQIKETANKQISSSRTSTTTTAARASRSSNFSVTTSTSSRRTTTTTTTAANKKPMVVTRMSGKSATALSKTSAKTSNVIKNKMQNGMCETKDSKVISEVTTATTTITVTNEQEILQKDLSPIDPTTDNQLLISVD